MIHAITIQELRTATKKVSPKIVQARELQFNRAAIDHNLVDILVLPALTKTEDKLKYLDTGLNQIAVTSAAKNKVMIGIDMAALRKLTTIELGDTLARLKQTLECCKKTTVKLAYTNAYTSEGAQALLRLLGVPTKTVAQAISF